MIWRHIIWSKFACLNVSGKYKSNIRLIYRQPNAKLADLNFSSFE